MIKRILLVILLISSIGLAKASNNFHVVILGDNKLHPGEETYITLLIENEGIVSGFYLNESTAAALQLITTAKDLRVKINDEFIPIKVESANPFLIGDLPAGRVAKAVFKVRVDENAGMGEYRVPVELKYTSVKYERVNGGVIITYSENECDTEYVTINITKKDYDFAVIKINSNLKTNGEGSVEVTIKNTGLYPICNAVLMLNATPPLLVNPKAMSAYIGNLKPGEVAKAEFKVYVSGGALNQTYPAILVLRFKTAGGMPRILTKRIGLKVLREHTFEVLSVKSLITPPKTIPMQHGMQQGMQQMLPFIQMQRQEDAQMITIPSKGFVEVEIKVERSMKDAVAILSFDTPLIRAENQPCLGDLKRGETKRVLFYIKDLAPVGSYRASLFLRYKNELGDEVVSERHYVEITVTSSSPIRVVSIETRNVGVGMKGSVTIQLSGSDVRNLSLYLISPDPTITPISPAYFVGDLGVKRATFRISISGDAVSGTHKLYLIERFDFGDAKDLVSIESVPILVKPKVAYFEIVSIKSDLYPDETGNVEVVVKNIGSLTVYNAVVKLELNPPLTIAGGSSLSSLIGKSQPGLYFIGTLKPNQTAVAKFRVDVGKDAGAGYYPVNIVIEYYDSQGYRHISSPITASVEVREKPLITPLMATSIALAMVGLAIAVAFVRRAKRGKG